jgi:alkanesulfonate monooxygenase SsuD/methylene tetrahydromethanopterin reductase-like flavin-dependent oxidoreductase (luciferase family)
MIQIDARPPKRVRALGEVISAIRMLLAGETVNVTGSWVRLSSVALENPPDVPPPILAGTTGPQGIALAARTADGLLLPEGCGPKFIAHAKELTARAGHPTTSPLEIVVYAWLRIGEDRAARAELAKAVSDWVGSGLYTGPMREARIARSPDLGPIDRRAADEVAIVGTGSHCAAGVDRFVGAGAQRLIVAAVGADFSDQYDAFAEHVLPACRASGRPAA